MVLSLLIIMQPEASEDHAVSDILSKLTAIIRGPSSIQGTGRGRIPIVLQGITLRHYRFYRITENVDLWQGIYY
jgi:hypothetical protein